VLATQNGRLLVARSGPFARWPLRSSYVPNYTEFAGPWAMSSADLRPVLGAVGTGQRTALRRSQWLSERLSVVTYIDKQQTTNGTKDDLGTAPEDDLEPKGKRAPFGSAAVTESARLPGMAPD
jgi:hypothetical protein